MNPNLLSLIDSFAGCNVLVLGEAMLDVYLTGLGTRLAPEAPVPVVAVSDREDLPGGAANTAANAAALDARVTFLSVTGDDQEAVLLRRGLDQCGVATDCMIAHPARRTLTKQRVVANGHQVVRFDQGSTELLDAGAEADLIDRIAALWPHCDAVIVSDYGYGILTPNVIAALGTLQRAMPLLVVVDAKDLRGYHDVGMVAVKPNYMQAAALLGLRPAGSTRVRV